MFVDLVFILNFVILGVNWMDLVLIVLGLGIL